MTAQTRVAKWVLETFGPETAMNAPERSLRTAEEALELAQACGVEAATLHKLVDYVFARPVGKPDQEIAGTLVCLYSVAATLGIDADRAFEHELARIQQPEVVERCRRRQGEKRAALVELTGEGTELANVLGPWPPEPHERPDGPMCRCGRPRAYYNGWCGTACGTSYMLEELAHLLRRSIPKIP